jgi:hypothetical protein
MACTGRRLSRRRSTVVALTGKVAGGLTLTLFRIKSWSSQKEDENQVLPKLGAIVIIGITQRDNG